MTGVGDQRPTEEGGGGEEGEDVEREAGGQEPGRGPDPEAGAVDRADYDPTYDPAAPVYCEICGGTMIYTAACKLKCLRCGYARDCSDP